MDPMEQQAPQEQGGEVSAEQQDMFDILVAQGIKFISDKAKNIKDIKDPNSVATVMVMIISRVEDESAKKGMKFDNSVLLAGAVELLKYFLKITGVEPDEERLKEIVGRMIGMYFKEALKKGKMTKEQILQLSQEAQQIAGEDNPMAGLLSSKADQPPAQQPQPPSGILGRNANEDMG